MAYNKKKLDDKHLKILRELGTQSQNRTCFDCLQRGPTYINMSIGTFVCTSCSGILRKWLCVYTVTCASDAEASCFKCLKNTHSAISDIRGLNPPHRVKSISMASFTPEEMEFIKTKGNQFCHAVWLGLYDEKLNPFPDTKDEHRIRDFMISKYEKKRYYVAPVVALKKVQSSQSPSETSSSNTSSPTCEKSSSGVTTPSCSVSTPVSSSKSVIVTSQSASSISNGLLKITSVKSSSVELLAAIGDGESVRRDDPFSPCSAVSTSQTQVAFANFDNANIYTKTEPHSLETTLATEPVRWNASSSAYGFPPYPVSTKKCASPVFDTWDPYDEDDDLAAGMPLIPISESFSRLTEISRSACEKPNRASSNEKINKSEKNVKAKYNRIGSAPATSTFLFAAGVSAQFVPPPNYTKELLAIYAKEKQAATLTSYSDPCLSKLREVKPMPKNKVDAQLTEYCKPAKDKVDFNLGDDDFDGDCTDPSLSSGMPLLSADPFKSVECDKGNKTDSKLPLKSCLRMTEYVGMTRNVSCPNINVENIYANQDIVASSVGTENSNSVISKKLDRSRLMYDCSNVIANEAALIIDYKKLGARANPRIAAILSESIGISRNVSCPDINTQNNISVTESSSSEKGVNLGFFHNKSDDSTPKPIRSRLMSDCCNAVTSAHSFYSNENLNTYKSGSLTPPQISSIGLNSVGITRNVSCPDINIESISSIADTLKSLDQNTSFVDSVPFSSSITAYQSPSFSSKNFEKLTFAENISRGATENVERLVTSPSDIEVPFVAKDICYGNLITSLKDEKQDICETVSETDAKPKFYSDKDKDLSSKPNPTTISSAAFAPLTPVPTAGMPSPKNLSSDSLSLQNLLEDKYAALKDLDEEFKGQKDLDKNSSGSGWTLSNGNSTSIFGTSPTLTATSFGNVNGSQGNSGSGTSQPWTGATYSSANPFAGTSTVPSTNWANFGSAVPTVQANPFSQGADANFNQFGCVATSSSTNDSAQNWANFNQFSAPATKISSGWSSPVNPFATSQVPTNGSSVYNPFL